MGKQKFEVWHEYGSPHHYRGLEAICKLRGAEVDYFEFRWFRQMVKAATRRDGALVLRGFLNGLALIRRIFSGSKGVNFVVGAAPYDWRVLLLVFAVRNGNLLWHNSWPVWDGSNSAKSSRFGAWVWAKVFLPRVKQAFFVTEYAKSAFLRSDMPKMPISVVAHSFESEIFNAATRVQERSVPVIRLLFVGRLVKSKGIFDALDVVRRLSNRFSVKFSVVGSGADSKILSDAAVEQGLNVEFLGSLGRGRLAKEFQSSDFLLLPSKRIQGWEEAFGMVVIEAMACGCIPLCTDHAGPSEILSSEFPDLLSSEEDFVVRAEKYIDSLCGDGSKFHFVQKKAEAFAFRYSEDEVAKRWVKAF
ncbi:glycosyltransferase family 4 protein [Pseudaquabacterium rugosum]|uniref:Glycosyltransferase family 4 protein n=1 Tax=Pseudaquabacterium rugosum TaxID=2984194 RepID=A0ABU9B956_9BURK